MAALLEVSGLCKRFGGVTAVGDCSFAVEEASVTGLIGPNGSGKTTVFNLITGYSPGDRGVVTFAGRDVTGMDPGVSPVAACRARSSRRGCSSS